jgi:hypothetical protein
MPALSNFSLAARRQCPAAKHLRGIAACEPLHSDSPAPAVTSHSDLLVVIDPRYAFAVAIPNVGLTGVEFKAMRTILQVALVCSIVVAIAGTARAERWVVVNGIRLSVPEIQHLEGVSCVPIPNGSYWLDSTSGIWGYANDPRPQGHITDNCYNRGWRRSLSERGMLFSPYDFLRQGLPGDPTTPPLPPR